jgi:hypothetical protein
MRETTMRTKNIFKRLFMCLAVLLLSVCGAVSCGERGGPSSPAPLFDIATDNGTITVYPVEGAEYSLDGGAWQADGVFGDLAEGSLHEVYVRMKAAEGKPASAAAVKKVLVPLNNAIDVYLIGGQSNAVGISPVADLPEAQRVEYPNVKFFQEVSASTAVQGRWTVVQPGLGENASYFGPELGMASVLAPHYPLRADGKARAAIVKMAVGDTRIHNKWLPPSSYEAGIGDKTVTATLKDRIAGDLYCEFVRVAYRAVTDLKNEGYNPVIRGVAWMQGEGDAESAQMAANYLAHLTNLIGDLRAEFALPAMPFVIGEIASHVAGYRQTVAAMSAEVAATTPNVFFIPGPDLTNKPLDFWHLTGASQYKLGGRFGNALLDFTDTTPILSAPDVAVTAGVGTPPPLPVFAPVTLSGGGSRDAIVEWNEAAESDMLSASPYTVTGKTRSGGKQIRAVVTPTEEIIIDGVLNDKKWTEQEGITVLHGTATVKTAHNERGIYLGIDVRDDFIRTNYTYNSRFDREVWLNSGVGIYFNAGDGLYSFRMAANGLVRVYKSENGTAWTTAAGQANLFSDGIVTDFETALRVHGTANFDGKAKGFTMEFFFPYAVFGGSYAALNALEWQVLVTEQLGQTNANYTINNLGGQSASYDNPRLPLIKYVQEG